MWNTLGPFCLALGLEIRGTFLFLFFARIEVGLAGAIWRLFFCKGDVSEEKKYVYKNVVFF